jgi:hypothetical protein
LKGINKMAKTDFIPKRDGDLDVFEENFVNKLTIHAAALAMDPALVTELKTGINSHRLAFSNMISKRAESKSSTEDNYNKKVGAVNDLRRAAKIIKSMKNYTSAIGDDLQIIGSDLPPEDVAQLKPVLSTKVNGSSVLIKFRKGEADGIKLFSRRGPETEFLLLASTTQSPYVDNRQKTVGSLPEQREYYAVYFIDMSETGIVSDIIKVTIS